MLRKIISITGKPGLFRILSSGKQSLIVEELGTGRRFPATARDKVVSLGDIAMYTESGDTPLGEILDKVYASEGGKKMDIKSLAAKNGGLKDKFAEIVEDFDRQRVHDSDVKKLFSWYNILIDNGFDKFTEEEESKEEEPSDVKAVEEPVKEEPKKKAASKATSKAADKKEAAEKKAKKKEPKKEG